MALTVFAFLSAWRLTGGRADARRVRREDAGLAALEDARSALADFQVFTTTLTDPSTGTLSVDAISRVSGLYETAVEHTDAAVKALEGMGRGADARELRDAEQRFTEVIAAFVSANPLSPTEVDRELLEAERSAYQGVWNAASNAMTGLREARDNSTRDVIEGLGATHTTALVALGSFALVILAAGGEAGRRVQRRQRVEDTNKRLAQYEASLQDGLEMTKAESEVYEVSRLALHHSVPDLRVEMLVADSSRAHFTRMLVVDDDGEGQGGGCAVMSPLDCPSTSRGHTLVFPDSRSIDACPYLRDRLTGECSAVCVPVSVAGRTVGVTHAWRALGAPISRVDLSYLEVKRPGFHRGSVV